MPSQPRVDDDDAQIYKTGTNGMMMMRLPALPAMNFEGYG
jgi:hypothetical protein